METVGISIICFTIFMVAIIGSETRGDSRSELNVLKQQIDSLHTRIEALEILSEYKKMK